MPALKAQRLHCKGNTGKSQTKHTAMPGISALDDVSNPAGMPEMDGVRHPSPKIMPTPQTTAIFRHFCSLTFWMRSWRQPVCAHSPVTLGTHRGSHAKPSC